MAKKEDIEFTSWIHNTGLTFSEIHRCGEKGEEEKCEVENARRIVGKRRDVCAEKTSTAVGNYSMGERMTAFVLRHRG